MSEGFFDDHPPPRSVRLFGQSGVTELLDDRSEEALADGQIEQDIDDAVLLSLLGQRLLEMSEGLSLRKIRRQIVHTTGEPRRGFVDPARRRQRLYHFGQALGPLLGRLVVTIDPNNGEPVRKLAGLYQMVQRRCHETLG